MGRKRLFFLSLAVLMVIPSCVRAQAWSGVLNRARAIDWSVAGAGPIPNRTAVCTTIAPYSGSAATINSAIASCLSGQVVQLQPGTFALSSGIVFRNKNNVTLRGAGPDQTFVVFTDRQPRQQQLRRLRKPCQRRFLPCWEPWLNLSAV